MENLIPDLSSSPTEEQVRLARGMALRILSNCALKYVHPERYGADPQRIIDQQIDNAAKLLAAYGAECSAQTAKEHEQILQVTVRKMWKKRKWKQKLEQGHTNTAQKVRDYLNTNPEVTDTALLSAVRGQQPPAPTQVQGPAVTINYKDILLITCRSVEDAADLIDLLIC